MCVGPGPLIPPSDSTPAPQNSGHQLHSQELSSFGISVSCQLLLSVCLISSINCELLEDNEYLLVFVVVFFNCSV